jgi:xylose dehydrogenase (NAD/NADP)
VVIAAVASRDAAKAQEFAREFSIVRSFGCYEELLADAAIDAVYIPLPNSLHAEWSIQALRAGKHVLCEKPLASTAAQARAMFAAARSHGVHLVEGYPYRAQPQTLRLRELLRQNTIGEVRMIQASFAFTLGEGANIRLQRELDGGALMDIGSYPVSLALMVAGSRPIRVQALAQWTESGVDRALAATLEFANGPWAQIACSFSGCLHREALIVGANGLIQTTYLNHTSDAAQASLRLRIGTGREARDSVLKTAPANGFLAEADAFANLVEHGAAAWPGATPQESLDIAMTLEALLESARSGQAVEIAPG